jgi:hypothetical protein
MDQRVHAGDSDADRRHLRSDRSLEAQERFGLVVVTLFEVLLGVAIADIRRGVALGSHAGCRWSE